MITYPATPDMFALPHISNLDRWSPVGAGQSQTDTSGFASAAWIAANRAYYFPITLPIDVLVKRLFWANGGTPGTNNIQIGVYRDDFTSFLLGTATLAAGASVLQYDNVTDTLIPAGRYYLAMWCNGTTTTVIRKVPGVGGLGFLQENSLAGGLPATANPIAAANQFVPIFGLDLRGTP